MKILCFLSILFFNCQFVFGQVDSLIKTEVYFDSAPPANHIDSFFYSVPNVIFIDFMEGFDDTVFLYRNVKCIDTMLLITNESIGWAGATGFYFDSKMDIIEFKILFKKTNLMITEKLNLNFKHLQIRRIYNWSLYYSNHFPRLE
jgi:hypothetical protein